MAMTLLGFRVLMAEWRTPTGGERRVLRGPSEGGARYGGCCRRIDEPVIRLQC